MCTIRFTASILSLHCKIIGIYFQFSLPHHLSLASELTFQMFVLHVHIGGMFHVCFVGHDKVLRGAVVASIRQWLAG